jgi:hypothetical protein
MSLSVSLTSISSRLSILPKTLRSLLNQTLKPSSIHVFLSKESYGIDDGCSSLPMELKILFATEPLLHLHYTPNIGPYRKIIPFSQLFPNTPVLVVDDDTVYSSQFVETAYSLWKLHSCCISFRAVHIDHTSPYVNWPAASGEKDILLFAKGNGGVVYHTSWFQDIRFLSNYSDLAPFADDIWLNIWRISLSIPCYAHSKSCIQSTLPTKTNLFLTNETQNDPIFQSVWKFLLPRPSS